MWLVGYIKQPKYQKYLYKSMGWLTLINLILAAWVNISFIVGAIMPGRSWTNLYTPLTYDAALVVCYLIIYYALGEKVTKFYRWDEQDWWPYGDEIFEEIDDDQLWSNHFGF